SCDSPRDTAAPGATSIGVTSTDEVWAMIGPEGGTLSITTGVLKGTELVVPRGALQTMTRISARPSIDSTPRPDGVTRAGPTVEFLPDGLHFDVPATLTV